MANLISVRMPNGQVINNVPEGTTRQELQSRLDAMKQQPSRPDPAISQPTTGTFINSAPFDKLRPKTQDDPFGRTRAQELGIGEDDFTFGQNMQGFGELGLHIASFLPSEAANSIGGAITAGVAIMDDDPATKPMDAYMVGRGITEQELADIPMAFGLEGVGKYHPRTREGKFFVEKFNNVMEFLAFGEEAEEFSRDKNLPDEVSMAARIVGDGWLLALGLLGVKSSSQAKATKKQKQIADNIIADAEAEASRLISKSTVEADLAARTALSPSEALKPPPTSKLGTPPVNAAESIVGGTRMQSEFAGILTEGAKDIVQGKESGKRIFEEVATLIEDGYFGLEAVVQSVKTKHGLTNAELGKIFKETGTEAGRFLNNLSRVKKDLQRLAKENPAMADLLAAFEKHKTPQTAGDSVFNWMRKMENTRRTGLTSQLITAVRNAQAGTVMGLVNAIERVVAVPVRGGTKAIQDRSFRPLMDEMSGLFEMSKAMGRITPSGRKKLREIMENHPLQKSVLFSKRNPLTAEVYGDLYAPRLMQVLQTFNRTQEHFFLRSAMELSLRDKLARQGKNFNTINPKDIPQKMIEDAFQAATEVVFASRPKGQTVKRVVDAWNSIPALSMAVTPFPRFMFANYIPFAGEFGPHSLLRFLSKDARTKFLKDPDYASRVIARSTAGTAALSLFLHNAMHKDPSAKPTELQIGDEFFDMTPLAPITAPMMILAEAMVAPENISNKDLLSAVTGVNRNGPTLFGTALDQKTDNLGEVLMRMGGDYMGSFFVPLAQLKDLSAGFSPDEAIVRSTKGHPLLGPIMKNLPASSKNAFINEMAPPAFNPLYPGAKRYTNPWRNQLTGSRPKTKTTLEREAERLDIEYSSLTPGTGDRKVDNMVNYYWGHLNQEMMLPALKNTPAYVKGSKAVKRKLFKDMLRETKPIAIARFAANHPREGGKLLVKMATQDKDTFAVISEMYGKTPDELRSQLEELYIQGRK